MAFRKSDNKSGDFSDRPMVQGNWTCNECNKEISELPFEPAQDRPIFCRDCWQKRRQQKSFSPRQTVQGNWTCSECNTQISELPFEPSPDQPIYCRSCWQTKKGSRFSR